MATQLHCSNGMKSMMSWRLGGTAWLTEWINEWINQSISYKAVCRRAPPATLGLLIKIIRIFTPASASTDLTAFSNAFWPTHVVIFLPLAHNSNPLVYFNGIWLVLLWLELPRLFILLYLPLLTYLIWSALEVSAWLSIPSSDPLFVSTFLLNT